MDLYKARVHLIIAEPGIRRTLRDMLRTIGFEDIILGQSFEEIRIAITENLPDLIIIGSSFAEGDVAELISDIRHNRVGKDPFLPVISLTAEPTEDLVGGIARSGSDDLLVYPLSPAQLETRVKALVERRKPFVVTTEYIGPDRRAADSYTEGQGEISRIDVPNALRATVKNEMSKAELKAAIASAITVVNGERLGRSGDHIAWLINRVLAAYAADNDGILEPKVQEFLKRMQALGHETTKRIKGTAFEHVSYLCETLVEVSARMEAAGNDASEVDKALLPELANAFKTAFTKTDDHDVSRKIRDMLKSSKEPVAKSA